MDRNGIETDGLFPRLEPPPGGWSRLRARIREAPRRRRARVGRLVLAAAGAAMLCAAAVVIVSSLIPSRPLVALPGLASDLTAVQLGYIDPPVEPVSVRPDLRGDFAVRRVPTTDARVVFYLVGARSAGPPVPSGSRPAVEPPRTRPEPPGA
jgi:hypothetical protein